MKKKIGPDESRDEFKKRMQVCEGSKGNLKNRLEVCLMDYQSQLLLNELLSLSLKPMPFDDMLALFIKSIVSVPWFAFESKGAIFLVEDNTDVIRMHAHYNMPEDLIRICARVPFGRCLCGRTAASGKIVFKNHLDGAHENTYEGIKPHGHYCIPIMSTSKKLLGVITLYVKVGQSSSRKEMDFLKAVADVVAIILDRRTMTESLIQAEKMTTLGELAAGVAHDINNPLGVMAMRLYSLSMENNDLAPEVKLALDAIKSQVQRIQVMVDRLLLYARKKVTAMVPMDINSVLGTIVPLIGHYREAKNVKWENELSGKLPKIKGDFHQLQEVFINLALNACQAMKGKGTIRIKSEYSDKLKAVIVSVSDTGPGIPQKNISRIFDPFFTTKEEGTGLGLSICQNIVNSHGGKIEVASEHGKGTTFRVTLPA